MQGFGNTVICLLTLVLARKFYFKKCLSVFNCFEEKKIGFREKECFHRNVHRFSISVTRINYFRASITKQNSNKAIYSVTA